MTPRVLVVEHQESCPPAHVGRWLEEAGCVLDVRRPWRGDDLLDPTAYDALLVLGGEMGAHDDDRVAWLAPLKERIRTAAAARVPTLGICLGHQLVAVALGGRVEPNPHGQTVGLQPVGWTPAAPHDPLLGDHTGAERAIHWNDDVVVVAPDGTVVLATTADGHVQAARFADSAWGVQAHPEADADVVRRWAELDRDRHLDAGIDQDAALAAIHDAREELDRAWRPVARRFAALAAGRRQVAS